MGYETDAFPAFFTTDSGCPAPMRVDSARQVAQWIHACSNLGLSSGSVVAVPNPEPVVSGRGEDGALGVDDALALALEELEAAPLPGKQVTPFLLRRLNELTMGATLRSNVALVMNNARVGAGIAVELSRIRSSRGGGGGTGGEGSGVPITTSGLFPKSVQVAVVGGAGIDLMATASSSSESTGLTMGTSNPGKVQRSWGGVGRNIAEAMARLARSGSNEGGGSIETNGSGPRIAFVGAVGGDADGTALLGDLSHLGVDTSLCVIEEEGARTSSYVAIMEPVSHMRALFTCLHFFYWS